MINYFIKFDDLSLSTVRLFTYDENGSRQVKKYSVIDAKEALLPGNNLYIMIPSALFGFKVTRNEIGLKNDILKANIFSESEDGIISTFAGTTNDGYSGDNGQALNADISGPDDIKIDESGNIIFFSVYFDHGIIRKINTSGIITTIAGTDQIYNGDNILAKEARINIPRNPWVDKNGKLFFAESSAHRIRKIDLNGVITTIAGTGTQGFSGDGGLAVNAMISGPRGVTGDNNGNIYISDNYNSVIRKVDTNGIITTYAGTGESGYSGDGGAATSAKIYSPYDLTTDHDGNLYFADAANHVIRKVDKNGIITTVAGTPETSGYGGDGGLATSATLYRPTGLVIDRGDNIYFCDTYNDVIRKISKNGIISTIAGTGTQGYSGNGSPAASAKLYKPFGIAVDSLNNIYITDSWNYIIRKIDASYHTLTGTPTNSDVGTTTMTFTASDGQGGSATQSFALKVINTNDAPVLTSVTNVTTNEDTAKTLTLSGTDVDGDALTYSAVSDTSAVTVSVSSATLTLTPAANWHGASTITAYASDGTAKDSTSFTFTVTPVNDAPLITTVADDSTNEETEKVIVLDAFLLLLLRGIICSHLF